jgi:hypothetical protein
MSLPITEHSAHGHEYKTHLMPASESLVVLPKLIVLLGKNNTALLLATPGDKLGKLLEEPEVLAAIFHTISTNAADNNGLLVMREIMRRTTVKVTLASGTAVDASLYEQFDTHFAGRLMEMFEVFIAVARASFTAPSPGK